MPHEMSGFDWKTDEFVPLLLHAIEYSESSEADIRYWPLAALMKGIAHQMVDLNISQLVYLLGQSNDTLLDETKIPLRALWTLLWNFRTTADKLLLEAVEGWVLHKEGGDRLLGYLVEYPHATLSECSQELGIAEEELGRMAWKYNRCHLLTRNIDGSFAVCPLTQKVLSLLKEGSAWAPLNRYVQERIECEGDNIVAMKIESCPSVIDF